MVFSTGELNMIKIVQAPDTQFVLTAKDLRDGHVYISKSDPETVWIGNHYDVSDSHIIMAFSVCGSKLIFQDNSTDKFKEVDITITVE
jgi:hypothetical protein